MGSNDYVVEMKIVQMKMMKIKVMDKVKINAVKVKLKKESKIDNPNKVIPLYLYVNFQQLCFNNIKRRRFQPVAAYQETEYRKY